MTAFTIKTGSKMELRAEIDELDILSLALGQKAGITLDALPDQTFEGIITEISDTGTVSSGVTTYEVTLSVAADLSMKVGMNASATIIIEKRENIVKIPLEALQESGKEQFVYVGTATGEISLSEKRTVTTGISDGEFVEITKGLAAGEKINYIYTSGTQTSAGVSPFGGGGMGGGNMGGNASSAGNQIPGTSN
jgi:multidrug efflux pump subunit AcrA (membrane-fusion protein)